MFATVRFFSPSMCDLLHAAVNKACLTCHSQFTQSAARQFLVTLSFTLTAQRTFFVSLLFDILYKFLSVSFISLTLIDFLSKFLHHSDYVPTINCSTAQQLQHAWLATRSSLGEAQEPWSQR